VSKARRRGVNEIRLFPWELESMGEYSCSIPTGTTLWKMWKCDLNAYRLPPKKRKPKWVVGQYIPHKDPEFVGIRWFPVKLLEGPEPLDWRVPDWDNDQRYDRERDAERRQSAQAASELAGPQPAGP